MMRKVAILLLLCALAVAAKPWKDKGKDKGQGRGAGHAKQARVVQRVEYREFLPAHRTIVVDYYRSPAWADHRSDLPPGIYKQLRRKGHLPPGLEKKMVAFPPVLVEQLPPVPYGYERGFIGHVAVVWNPRTRVVFDFFAMN